MNNIGEKLRVVVEVKPHSDVRGNRIIFEGPFVDIAIGVISFLDKKYQGVKEARIGAVISGGTVPSGTRLNENIAMSHLRENPHQFLPTSMENLREEEIKLLRILGFIEEVFPEQRDLTLSS